MALIDDKILLIDNAEDLFAKQLVGADLQLIEGIKKIYAEFVEGGLLQVDPVKLAALDNLIIEIIGFTDYSKIANAYLANFDDLMELNALIHGQINGINVEAAMRENERIINHLEKVATQLRGSNSGIITVAEIIDGRKVLTEIPYGNKSLDALIAPLSDIMKDDIISGVSFQAAGERIEQVIKKKELGLTRWAGQIARDALSQQDGLVNNELRIEFGLDWISYLGTQKATTRPFCYHMLNEAQQIPYAKLKPILDEFIPKGVPSQVTTNQTPTGKRQAKGSAMIPGTDMSNFMIRRGGYNCRHQAVPTFKP